MQESLLDRNTGSTVSPLCSTCLIRGIITFLSLSPGVRKSVAGDLFRHKSAWLGAPSAQQRVNPQLDIWKAIVSRAVFAAAIVSIVFACAPFRATSESVNAVTIKTSLGGGNLAILKYATFDPGQHDLTWCGDHLCAIDGLPFFGTATIDQIPDEEVLSFTVILDDRRIPIETTGMFNPISPVEDVPLYVWLSDPKDGTKVLQGVFGEGGGAYYGEWILIEGRALRTVLTCMECLSISLQELRKGR